MDTEIYALCAERSAALARGFLDAFLPRRRAGRDDYPLPIRADAPTQWLASEAELLAELEADPGAFYQLYWDGLDGGWPRQAILFFTEDGSMIAGLVVKEAEAEVEVERWLPELARITGATAGYWHGQGDLPPLSRAGFEALVASVEGPKIVSGRFVRGRSPVG